MGPFAWTRSHKTRSPTGRCAAEVCVRKCGQLCAAFLVSLRQRIMRPRLVFSGMNFGRSNWIDSIRPSASRRKRFFAPSETGWSPPWLANRWMILDVGCGAGRFLDVASSAGVALKSSVSISPMPSTLRLNRSAIAPMCMSYRPVFTKCLFAGVVHLPPPIALESFSTHPIQRALLPRFHLWSNRARRGSVDHLRTPSALPSYTPSISCAHSSEKSTNSDSCAASPPRCLCCFL